VRIRAIGQLELLPISTVAAIHAAREATAGYEGMVLTIAVAYGGRAEIVDAVRALLTEERRNGATFDDAIAHISAEAISRHLYMAGMPDPDLSSAPAVKCACRVFCCGRALIASSIFRMSTGRPSVGSISCGQYALISNGKGGSERSEKRRLSRDLCRRVPTAYVVNNGSWVRC